jgi:ribosomal protein S16
MVRIRLARINRRRKKLKSKNFKSFRIVVVDSRKKRDSGDILADLGYYIPSYSGNKEGSLNGIFFKINDQELFEK